MASRSPGALCRLALEGLSLGDAFGEQFFAAQDQVEAWIAGRTLPPSPWYYTDDTVMALALAEVLEARSRVEQDALADVLAAKYMAQPTRGYGGSTRRLLMDVAGGAPWRERAAQLFGGMGSAGNGAAMRVAPLGAYFSSDPERAATEAQLSAEVTHSHPDGRSGAVAVALAAALVVQGLRKRPLLQAVVDHLPPSGVRDGVLRALPLLDLTDPRSAAAILGNGSNLLAVDTVPFVLWSVATCSDDFEAAMWRTVSVLGDRDTTCAMVGGLVALAVGRDGLPHEWLRRRESLDTLARIGWERAQEGDAAGEGSNSQSYRR